VVRVGDERETAGEDSSGHLENENGERHPEGRAEPRLARPGRRLRRGRDGGGPR
jgi:hypothetical protein